MEDSVNEISVFLKRFRYTYFYLSNHFLFIFLLSRSTYETEDNKTEGLPPISDNNNFSPMKKKVVLDSFKVTVPIATIHTVMEFMAESYGALWQSNMKNGIKSIHIKYIFFFIHRK